MSNLDQLMTIEELATEIRTTPGAIYAARHRGSGPRAIRVGRRLLFHPDDVAQWINENKEPRR